MNLSIFKFIRPVFIALIFLTSCKKHLPPCSGHCFLLTYSGNIYDGSTNAAIGGAKFSAGVHPSCYCFYSYYPLITGQSGQNGYFFLAAEFDTTLLQKNYLTLDITAPDNYIYNPVPVSTQPAYSNKQELSFISIDSAAMNNIRLNFYSKVLLHISLHRTSAIGHDRSLGIECFFDGNRGRGFGFEQSGTNQDTTITLYTALNMFTSIRTYKTIGSSLMTTLDSVKCTNGNNTITVNY